MKTVPAVLAAALALVILAPGAWAQTEAERDKDPRPVPRAANGRPDFWGVWQPGDIYLIEDIELALEAQGKKVPINAAGTALMKSRLSREDPEANCLPTGVPRQAPYPWRILQHPTHIFFLFEGNIHSYRQIFMDGRAHPEDPNPTWYGDSVGYWDGDTLVIDTVGFNDRFWFDFVGHPHSEELRTIERYTRTNYTTLVEEVTIIDPVYYTEPFTIRSIHTLREGFELMEYICQENEADVDHIIGPAGRP